MPTQRLSDAITSQSLLITTDVALSILKMASVEFHENPPRLSSRDAGLADSKNPRRHLETEVRSSGGVSVTRPSPSFSSFASAIITLGLPRLHF